MRKLRYIALLSLTTSPLAAQVLINWGTGFVADNVVQRDGNVGNPVSQPDYTFALGSFGSFVPTDQNVDQWATNWKPFDAITSPDGDASDGYIENTAFLGSDQLNANQTSASSDSNGTDTFGEGEQAYVWVYNNQNLQADTQWALYTQTVNGPCDNCLDGAWLFPDATSTVVTPNFLQSEADTAIWGGINDSAAVGGGIIDSTPGSYHVQTAGFSAGIYWDLDDTIAGSGPDDTPDGTWNAANTNWNPVSDGTAATGTFISHSVATFSAGTDATGNYTVIKDGSEDVYGLNFQNGTVTIEQGTGGAINFDRAGQTFYINESGNQSTANSFINTTGTTTIETVLSGSEDLDITGGGTLILAGEDTPSTLTGTVTIDGGTTLQLSGEGTGDKLDTDIVIEGTLIIDEAEQGTNNQLGSNANIELTSGGLISVVNSDELAGTFSANLTTGDSTIDFNADDNSDTLAFADSSGQDITGTDSIIISNWEGQFNIGDGQDQLIFGTDTDGLTLLQEDLFIFRDPFDPRWGQFIGDFPAIQLSDGEIVPFIVTPVPEPSTIAGALVLLGAVCGFEVRRRRKSKSRTV